MRLHSSRSFLLVAATLFLAPALAVSQGPAEGMSAADTIGLPLQPARWARFTTSKGTWMSLDVSPDGQSIVFDMLGDLYSIPITGGEATRIAEGLPFEMQHFNFRHRPLGNQRSGKFQFLLQEGIGPGQFFKFCG